MAKIYIIGSVGSGKTTLAKRLSCELNIPYYELDNIVYEYQPNGDRKRSAKEIEILFEEILNNDDWIIENVGRSYFNKGFDDADTIIYLQLSKNVLYRRIILRWVKQNLGIENATYKSDLKMLKQMLLWAKKEMDNIKLNNLSLIRDKVIVLDEKSVKKYRYR